jgi:hypothetical protein
MELPAGFLNLSAAPPRVAMPNGYDELHKGGRRSTVYYWLDPDTGAALYHTAANGDTTVPFFSGIGEAEMYLERRAEADGDELYDHYSLYEAKTQKVVDAVDVLTDQAGFEDFFAAED